MRKWVYQHTYIKSIIQPTKYFLSSLLLFSAFLSCDTLCKEGIEQKEPFQTYWIASKRSFTDFGEKCSKVYFIRRANETVWTSDVYWLDGLDYRDGIEYQVLGARAVQHTYLCSSVIDIQGLIIQKVLTENKTNSINLPENKWYWDPSWDEGYNPFLDSVWLEQNTL